MPDLNDPGSGVEMPAGEYVVVLKIGGVVAAGRFSTDIVPTLLAATRGVAQAEFSALPRVTIVEGQRTVVNLDYDDLKAKTRALISVVYHMAD